MENNTTVIKFVSSGILAIFTAWFGTIGPLICLLLICMIGDYITGLINAGISGTISSVKGLKGIVKKMLYMVAVCVGMCIDWLLLYLSSTFNINVPVTTFFGALVAVWLIINELTSILENISSYVPLPAFLSKILEKAKDTVEDVGNTQADNTNDKIKK